MNICIMTDLKKKTLFHLKTRQTVLIENQSLHLLPVIGRHKKKKSALNIAYLSKQIHEISTSCSHTALRPLDSPRS